MSQETSDTNAQEPPPATPDQADQAAKSPTGHMRKGKVARLRKVVRDRLNLMLQDGVSYADILKTLAEDANGVTEQNITNWVSGGYKDWVLEQQRLEETRVKQEVAMDLACPDGGSKIHEATLQLAATRLSEMVRKLDYTHFEDLLRDDPAKLIPFLNALATISNAELKCERHRIEFDALSAHAAAPGKPAGLSRETRLLMEKELHLK